jgi:hypothetical protein
MLQIGRSVAMTLTQNRRRPQTICARVGDQRDDRGQDDSRERLSPALVGNLELRPRID